MKHDPDMLRWIAGQADNLRRRVERWCSINSHTSNLTGLEQLSDEVAEAFSSLAQVRRISFDPYPAIDDAGQPVEHPVAPALSLQVRPEAPVQVLLVIHLDTVYPPQASDPRLVRLDDDTLRGPGVADAKGGAALMLTALQAFEQNASKNNLGYRVILNTDEEIGSPASASLLAEAAWSADLGLVFEPTLPDGGLIGQRKGSGNFTIVVKGTSAHAGREPERGRNAVIAAGELASALHTMNQKGVMLNIGRIAGGGELNTVPDCCVLRFNLRVDDAAQQQGAVQQVESMVNALDQRTDYSATLHGRFHNPPKPMTPALAMLLGQVEQVGMSLGLSLSHQSSGGVCDGNKLAAAGLATVDTLGPVGGHIHSPLEYVSLSSLTQRTQLTAALLCAYASNQMQPPPRTV